MINSVNGRLQQVERHILLAITTLLAVACSDEPERVVTIGDNEPILELPDSLKNANPNIKKSMTSSIGYREGGSSGEFTPLESNPESATQIVDSPEVAGADAYTLPSNVAEEDYQVKVEWTYPGDEQGASTSAPVLASITYGIDVDGGDSNEAIVTAVDSNEAFFPTPVHPLGLNNIQLLNRKYTGDLAEIIDIAEADPAPLQNYSQTDSSQSQLTAAGANSLVADYISGNINYDDTYQIGARWGINNKPAVKPTVTQSNNADEVIAMDFQDVTFSAEGNDSEVYFQLTNNSSQGAPFRYPVEIFFNRVSASGTKVTLPDDDLDDFSDISTLAYRLAQQENRLDFKWVKLDADQLVYPVEIKFYSKDDQTMEVASWEGNILFPNNVAGEASGGLLLSVSDQQGMLKDERIFGECTPLIITAELTASNSSDVEYKFAHDYEGLDDFIAGTADNPDGMNVKNIKLPPLRSSDAGSYQYTVSVEAIPNGQQPVTSELIFIVNDRSDVNGSCS